MRFFSVFAALLLFPLVSQACSYAYQYSLFPLGLKGQDTLLFLEVDFERYVTKPEDRMFRPSNRFDDAPPTAQTRWKGFLRIKYALRQQQELQDYKNIAQVDFDDANYVEALEPYWEQTRQFCSDLTTFQAFDLPEVGYCYYEKECNFFNRQIDSLSGAIRCQNAEGQTHDFYIPARIESRLQAGLQSASDLQSALVEWNKAWKAYSLRRYRLADGSQLLIYTLGRGQRRFYQAKTPTGLWQAPDLSPQGYYIEGQDVLFHGQRIDSWIFIEKK